MGYVQMEIAQEWIVSQSQSVHVAEFYAGAYAEVIPSPLTRALSSFQGRLISRTVNMLFLGHLEPILYYYAIRPYSLMAAIRYALSARTDVRPLVVDPLAGFNTHLYWLAQEMPHVDFLELDFPELIQTKRDRLRGFQIPPNLQMEAVDYTSVSLGEALGERRATVMIASAMQIQPAAFVNVLEYLRDVLTPNGSVIGCFPLSRGVEHLQRNLKMVSRFIGEIPGMIDDEQQIIDLFANSSYDLQKICTLAETALRMGKATPAEVEVFAIGKLR